MLDRYEWLLGKMRLLPFQLMLARAVDELAPGGRLERRLGGRVAHVQVGTSTRTSTAVRISSLAALPAPGATATLVGDDDQAIYQWRGGEVELFRSFPRRFPGTHLATLETNHRCRPEIVGFATPLVATLPGRIPKQLLAAARRPHPASWRSSSATQPVMRPRRSPTASAACSRKDTNRRTSPCCTAR